MALDKQAQGAIVLWGTIAILVVGGVVGLIAAIALF
jgi:hypothetical protein